MRLYNIILSLHIASAVVLIGGSILVAPMFRGWIRKAERVSEIRRWLIAGKPLAKANPISAIALLATGIYLASVGHWWRAAWVQVAVVLWVVASAVAKKVVEPQMGRIADLAFSSVSEDVSAELDRARNSRLLAIGSDVLLANDLGILFLMSNKPGIVGSIAAIVVANALVLGYRVAHERIFERRALTPAPATGVDGVTGPMIAR